MGLTVCASHYQDRARGEVESALQQRASLPQKLCQLLSGQQLSAAAALASATGDVRLASLICQVTDSVLALRRKPACHIPICSIIMTPQECRRCSGKSFAGTGSCKRGGAGGSWEAAADMAGGGFCVAH